MSSPNKPKKSKLKQVFKNFKKKFNSNDKTTKPDNTDGSIITDVIDDKDIIDQSECAVNSEKEIDEHGTWKKLEDLNQFLDCKEKDCILIEMTDIKNYLDYDKHILYIEELLLKNRGLLEIHKHLHYLQNSRDEIFLKIHESSIANSTHFEIAQNEFSIVDEHYSKLEKMMWTVLDDSWSAPPRDGNIWTEAIAMVETEESLDEYWLGEHKQSNFIPPGRPRSFKNLTIDKLTSYFEKRFLKVCSDQTAVVDLWLVHHLETIKFLVLQDLKILKQADDHYSTKCFNLLQEGANFYHNCIKQHLSNLVAKGLKTNSDVFALLSFVHEYRTSKFMNSPELGLDIKLLPTLLDQTVISNYEKEYVRYVEEDVDNLLTKALERDKTDWYNNTLLEVDGNGCYYLLLPQMVSDITYQNLKIAKSIGGTLDAQIASIILKLINKLLKKYQEEICTFQSTYLKNPSSLPFYNTYIIAHLNGTSLIEQYLVKLMDDFYFKTNQRQKITGAANLCQDIAKQCTGYLTDEMCSTISKCLKQKFCTRWDKPLDYLEDLCQCITTQLKHLDFVIPCHRVNTKEKFEEKFYDLYIDSILTGKFNLRSYKCRMKVVERLLIESKRITETFIGYNYRNSRFSVIKEMSELIKLEDDSLVQLELSAFHLKHPYFTPSQLAAVLAMRCDISPKRAKNMIEETVPCWD